MSNPKVITPPTQVIATATLRTLLRADSGLDTLIAAHIVAATEMARHYTGLSIGEQTLEIALDAFPAAGSAIELPYGPVASISSVKYIEDIDDATELTIDSANYTLDSYQSPGWVIPATDYDWPTPLDGSNVVKVRYVAGTAVTEGAIYTALVLITQMLLDDPMASDIPMAARAMLDTAKDYSR